MKTKNMETALNIASIAINELSTSDCTDSNEIKDNLKAISISLNKVFNMHDELVNALKKAIDISPLWTFNKNVTAEHEDEARALHSMKLEFDRLIKKASE